MNTMRWTGALAGLIAASALAQAPVSDLAATVNGTGITNAKLRAQVDMTMQQRGMSYGGFKAPEVFEKIRNEVLAQLVAQELLWQEAERREHVAADDEVDQVLAQIKSNFDSEQAFLFRIEAGGFTDESYREDLKHQISVRHMVVEDIAADVTVSDEKISEFYSQNLDKMKPPVEIRARHILIELEPGADDAEQAAARGTIGRLLDEARGGADFAALAQEHSDDSSAAQGGDLGFFGRGVMVPPFDAAAFELEPGEISDVVQTQFGYHIIKVEERRGGEVLARDEVADRIRQHLQQLEVQSRLDALVEELRAQGDVEILIKS
jgi:peptidyl-prolyl cis-trans isomerase C